MVNIISTNASLSARNTNIGSESAYKAYDASSAPNKNSETLLPKDIVSLSKAADDALEAYKEYKTRVQVSASDVNTDVEETVFDTSKNQIMAASKFKAQLAVLEKKSELYEVLKSIQ